jgi:hypothetical protein
MDRISKCDADKFSGFWRHKFFLRNAALEEHCLSDEVQPVALDFISGSQGIHRDFQSVSGLIHSLKL